MAWGSSLLSLNRFGGEYLTDTHVDHTHKDSMQKEGGSQILVNIFMSSDCYVMEEVYASRVT